MLTQSRLKELLSYDPETGVFTRIGPTKGRAIGSVAGTVRPDGYVTVIVDRRPYAAARLAWLYMTGAFPDEDIDHRDRCPGNNRFANLREATRSQNNCNTKVRRDSKSGVKGVGWHKASALWHATIKIGGVTRSLGYHKSIAAAADARRAAEVDVHGEYRWQPHSN